MEELRREEERGGGGEEEERGGLEMWGELGGGRGNLMCVPHDLNKPYIPHYNCKRRSIVYLLFPMATYNPPPLANTLWLGTHSGNIAGGNAL